MQQQRSGQELTQAQVAAWTTRWAALRALGVAPAGAPHYSSVRGLGVGNLARLGCIIHRR